MTFTDEEQAPSEGRLVEDVNSAFRRMRELLAVCQESSSKHDLAMVLIAAAINEGFDSGPRITGALERLGFNKRHIGKTLTDFSKPNESQLWFKSTEGRYQPGPRAIAMMERST